MDSTLPLFWFDRELIPFSTSASIASIASSVYQFIDDASQDSTWEGGICHALG